MSSPSVSTAPRALGFLGRFALAFGAASLIIVLAVGSQPGVWGQILRMAGHARLHAPRMELITQAPLALQIHLATVLAAFVLATVLMVGRKGRAMHRVLGWAFVVLILITAVAALLIRGPLQGHFSPLHLFSLWVLVAIPLAVRAARRHNVVRHSRAMMGLYFGGLMFAGALAFLPGRLLWRVMFG